MGDLLTVARCIFGDGDQFRRFRRVPFHRHFPPSVIVSNRANRLAVTLITRMVPSSAAMPCTMSRPPGSRVARVMTVTGGRSSIGSSGVGKIQGRVAGLIRNRKPIPFDRATGCDRHAARIADARVQSRNARYPVRRSIRWARPGRRPNGRPKRGSRGSRTGAGDRAPRRPHLPLSRCRARLPDSIHNGAANGLRYPRNEGTGGCGYPQGA